MVSRRSGAKAVRFCAVAVVLASAALLLRRPFLTLRRDALLQDAVVLANRQDVLAPRLAFRSGDRELLAAVIRGPSPSSTTVAAEALLEATTGDTSPAAIHGAGVALLVDGEDFAAVERLRSAASRESHAEWWSDLAAAEIHLGDAAKNPDHYLAALEAADRALTLDAVLPEAHFNRALIVEKLGFERAAVAEWRAFAAKDSRSAMLVLRHIDTVSHKQTAREQWTAAQQRITSIATAELERLIDAHPQEARIWGETMFLSAWAQKLRAGDATADIYLDRTRVIANRLASRSGERLLADAVAAADRLRALGARRQLQMLIGAQVAYFDGRLAFRSGMLEDAARNFENARRDFAACGSPMDGVAQLYLAMTEIRRNRTASARAMVAALLERETGAVGHHAIVAHLKYLIALCDGMNGRWGDAIENASASRDEFDRLGEHAFAGSAEMLIGESLALLGRPQLAWRHLCRASLAFSASGDADRLQVCAATMNQVELRRHQWGTAKAISKIELTLWNDPELLAHAHLRSASAEASSGNSDAAFASLRKAVVQAKSVANAESREKLLADITAVEGRIVAVPYPAVGVNRLTESIAFQNRVGRVFALPSLYLDRGRARAALHSDEAALADFEQGISSLETQRGRVRDYELRAGIFDDTRELFTEAVAATLRRGDSRRAFEYLERGRARTLLDELADSATPPERVTIEAVQESLRADTLLVAYALLPDRLAIFVIDRRHLMVRFSSVRANEITRDVSAFVHAIGARREMSALSARLYDALIAPIAANLSHATALVVVPDPAIEQLPFAALRNLRAGKYLVESHEISIVPSAAVFVACVRRSGHSTSKPPGSIAVFANPALPAAESLPFLPAADAEAAPIARCYPRSLVLRRNSATTERFRNEAARYEIVQFSGHARMDRAEPWKSGLMLDMTLSAREISMLRFTSTKVMVLAACSTMAPDDEHVEGTSAIARSFLIAGVPAVVGSLWDVDDASAAALIKRLHRHISSGMPAATALRETQRELLKDPMYRDPSTWAAFTVLGVERTQ